MGGLDPPGWAVGHFCPGILVGLGRLGAQGGLVGVGRGPQTPPPPQGKREVRLGKAVKVA